MKRNMNIIAMSFVIHCHVIFGTGHDTEHRRACEISLNSTSSNHDLTVRATRHDSYPIKKRQLLKKFCCCIYSKKTDAQAKQKATKYAQLADPAKDTPTSTDHGTYAQRYFCCFGRSRNNSIAVETNLDNSPVSIQKSKPR